MAKRENAKINDIAGYVLGGAAALGLGIGFLNDQLVPGVLIGGGVGLLLAACVRAFGKD